MVPNVQSEKKCQNDDGDATKMSSGSAFHIRRAETLKVQLPTIDSLNDSTTRRLVW